jgi:hypothetical protein
MLAVGPLSCFIIFLTFYGQTAMYIVLRSIPGFMVSPQVEKLFNSMKNGGVVTEDKAISAEKATSMSKLPKAQCMNALAELEKMGAAKKRKSNNVVAYYLTKTSL